MFEILNCCMAEREIEIRKASWIGIIGNGFLSALKIVVGFISGSLAVVADGIDSAGDVITSAITLFTARYLSKPPNRKYPYGYERADTVATKVLAFIIFFAGAQLLITTIRKLFSGIHDQLPTKLALYVTLISIVGKLLLALHQFHAGKKTGSNMLMANGKNMQNDVLISVSVLLGLICVYVFRLPVLDTVFALAVSLWVLWVAVKIFRDASLELMDGTRDCTIYEKIFDAIDKVPGAHHPHRVRARHIGHKIMIVIDLEVNGDLSLREAHAIAHRVEDSIKSSIDNVFDVTIHIEPLGDYHQEEPVGVNKSTL